MKRLITIAFLFLTLSSLSQVLDPVNNDREIKQSQPLRISRKSPIKIGPQIEANTPKLKFPRKAAKQLKDYQCISGGILNYSEPPINLKLTPNDRNLLIFQNNYSLNINPFLISNHEVTNKEYRDFFY